MYLNPCALCLLLASTTKKEAVPVELGFTGIKALYLSGMEDHGKTLAFEQLSFFCVGLEGTKLSKGTYLLLGWHQQNHNTDCNKDNRPGNTS